MTTWIRQTLTNFAGVIRKVVTRRRLIATVLAVAFVVPVVAYAQTALNPGLSSAGDIGLPDPGVTGIEDIRLIIARAVRFVLGFVGLLAVGVVIYGGYLWMTSAGDAEQVTEARTILRNGGIGLALIILSFAIVTFIINTFIDSVLTGGTTNNPGFQGCRNCIARGGGLIDDVYPDPGDRVPRDIDILVTFAEEIFVAPDGDGDEDKSFVQNAVLGTGTDVSNPASNGCPVGWWCGDNDPTKFRLTYTAPDNSTSTYDQFKIYTRDQLTFALDPVDLLGLEIDGQPIETATEAAILNVSLSSNPSALTGEVYAWSFTVTTQIDDQPPRIIEVSPVETNLSSRDDTVIITFNEAVHPVAVTGVQDGDGSDSGNVFSNLIVYADDTSDAVANYVPVDGEFLLGNGYRQVWFVPESVCLDSDGNPIRNSCNFEKYCLPADSNIRAVAKAATLKSSPACGQTASKPAEACSPFGDGLFDGVVDMSKNSLDGSRSTPLSLPSGDGVADGPAGDPASDAVASLGDTFAWQFDTNNQVFTSPPVITSLVPLPDTEGVDINDPFVATFNRTLLPSRTYKIADEIYKPARLYQQLDRGEDLWTNYQGSYGIRQSSVRVCSETLNECTRDSDCVGETNVCQGVCGNDVTTSCTLDNECAGEDNKCGQTNFNIRHTGLLDPNQNLEAQIQYEPRIGSTVQDRWQNCFYVPTTVSTIGNDLYGGAPPNFETDDVSVNQTVPPFVQFQP